jgi:hypothetical protein
MWEAYSLNSHLSAPFCQILSHTWKHLGQCTHCIGKRAMQKGTSSSTDAIAECSEATDLGSLAMHGVNDRPTDQPTDRPTDRPALCMREAPLRMRTPSLMVMALNPFKCYDTPVHYPSSSLSTDSYRKLHPMLHKKDLYDVHST